MKFGFTGVKLSQSNFNLLARASSIVKKFLSRLLFKYPSRSSSYSERISLTYFILVSSFNKFPATVTALEASLT